jgi:hypothetical protein
LPRAAASRLANGTAGAAAPLRFAADVPPAPDLGADEVDEVEEEVGGFAALDRGDVGTSIGTLVGRRAPKLPRIFDKSSHEPRDAPFDRGSTA